MKSHSSEKEDRRGPWITQFVSAIVIINACATFGIWRKLKLLQPRPPQPNKKLLKKLYGKPITPMHGKSENTRAYDNKEKQFFVDFEDFAKVVNWYLL